MNRGDVHRLRPPRRARGHEQRGGRYAVVLQADELPTSTVLVAPTSRSAAPAPFRPEVEIAGERTRVIVEQLRAVDPQGLGRPAGQLALEALFEIEDALRLILAI